MPEAPKPGAGLRVLLVEDIETNRAIATILLGETRLRRHDRRKRGLRSRSDYAEIAGVWGNGEMALPDDPPGELEVVEGMPEGGRDPRARGGAVGVHHRLRFRGSVRDRDQAVQGLALSEVRHGRAASRRAVRVAERPVLRATTRDQDELSH